MPGGSTCLLMLLNYQINGFERYFPIGLDFVFHMFFLVKYCKTLEEGSFRGRSSDFLWMLLFGEPESISASLLDFLCSITVGNLPVGNIEYIYTLIYIPI